MPQRDVGDCVSDQRVLKRHQCVERGVQEAPSTIISGHLRALACGYSPRDSGFPWSGLNLHSETLGWIQIPTLSLTGCVILDKSLLISFCVASVSSSMKWANGTHVSCCVTEA